MKDFTQSTCQNEDALISYLYDELDGSGRAQVEAHLVSCESCRSSVEGMRGVRAQLATWTLPERAGAGAAGLAGASREVALAASPADASGTHARPWWAPGALAAAAVILLAIGAAIANLEITYGRDGVRLRTGWARPTVAAAQTAAPAGTSVPLASASAKTGQPAPVSAGDLAALERRLRGEFRALAARTEADPRASAPQGAAASGPSAPSNAEVLRRVQALIEESETRQRRELALRVAQVVRDFDTQRQTDLVRIQQGLGEIEGTRAADRQLLNYLVRTSQRQR